MNMNRTMEEMCTWEMYSPASIIGCGRIKLKLKDGRIRNIHGVLHIPNLERNLIFVGKMDVSGGKNICGDGGWF